MEPIAAAVRPTRMRRLAPVLAALLLPLSLAACGSDDDSVAQDPAPTVAATSATPTPTSPPTVGSYPEYGPADYAFELTVSCFCMGAGVPIEVTVAGGEVVRAVYGDPGSGGRGGIEQGQPADKLFWMTINDVIAKANDTTAADVQVDWPAGQDYPNSVFVDGHKDIADDEVGYTIANVRVAAAD